MPPKIPNSLDAHWYWDVNRFAVHTSWAHGFMAFYAEYGAVGVLGVLLLAAWWRARSSPDPLQAVSAVLWAAGGTVLAWGLAHYGLKPLIARPRPYFAMPQAEVLLHKTTGYSFPSGHATVAGAVIVGLWLSRDKLMTILAAIVGLLLCFGRVYTGMHYPGDVAGGLVFGSLILLVAYPPAVALLRRFDKLLLDKTPLAVMVSSRPPDRHTRVGAA
ncbi:MAG: phosphatase PAP2 family protein [Acidimicrobiales bacterium]